MTIRSVFTIIVSGAQLVLAPLPGAAQICVGDCNDDGTIGVNELVRGVRIALRQEPVAGCPSLDVDSNESVTINELIRSVQHALEGCERRPTPTPTLTPTQTPQPTVFCAQNDSRPLDVVAQPLRYPRRLLEPQGRIAVGDVNGDAYDDIVIGDLPRPSAVYLGTPDRSIGQAICIPAASADPIIADLTNDGVAELVLHDRDRGVLTTFAYAGESGFARLFDGTADGQTLLVGHLDRDGSLDLIGFDSTRKQAHLYLGDGGGGFSPIEGLALGTAASTLAAADLDGDGTVELIVTEQTETVAILVNRGHGAFDPKMRYPTGIAGGPAVAGDFDDDGILDIVIVGFNYNDLVFLGGSGGASFEPRRVISIDPEFRTFDAPIRGDFDGDGQLDLAAISLRSDALLLYGDGTGGFPRQASFDQRAAPAGIWPGDIDGNGQRDLVRWVLGSAVEVDYRNATGSLEGHSSGPIPPPQATTVEDVNGDGFPDAVLIESIGRLTVRLGDGAGSLEPFEIESDLSLGMGNAAHRIHAVDDMNGDGFPDLVWSNRARSAVLYGSGNGKFELEMENAVPPGMRELTIARAGDISGDGVPDVASVFAPQRGSFQSIWIHEATPGGGYADPIEVEFPFGSSNSAWIESLALADLDGNGTVDLAAVNGNQVVVALNHGTSFEWQPEILSGQGRLRTLDAVAIDSDGATDLVAIDGSGSALVFLGTGNGSFASPVTYPVVSDPVRQWLSDFNGDGLIDLAVVHRDDEEVSVRLGSGLGALGDEVRYAIQPFAVADMDRDGVADLIALGPDRDRVDIFYGESLSD